MINSNYSHKINTSRPFKKKTTKKKWCEQFQPVICTTNEAPRPATPTLISAVEFVSSVILRPPARVGVRSQAGRAERGSRGELALLTIHRRRCQLQVRSRFSTSCSRRRGRLLGLMASGSVSQVRSGAALCKIIHAAYYITFHLLTKQDAGSRRARDLLSASGGGP